jgi:hypothetical protein
VIFATPVDTPVTTPVAEPAVAIAELPLLQVPPATISLSTVVDPRHTVVIPLITDGGVLTVTFLLAEHPVGKV